MSHPYQKHAGPFSPSDEGIDYRYYMAARYRLWLWGACARSAVRGES